MKAPVIVMLIAFGVALVTALAYPSPTIAFLASVIALYCALHWLYHRLKS